MSTCTFLFDVAQHVQLNDKPTLRNLSMAFHGNLHRASLSDCAHVLWRCHQLGIRSQDYVENVCVRVFTDPNPVRASEAARLLFALQKMVEPDQLTSKFRVIMMAAMYRDLESLSSRDVAMAIQGLLKFK